MKNFASRLLLAFFLLVPVAAFAQSTGTVVTDCTTGVGLAYTPGSTRPMTLLPTGKACVDAATSVSGFAPATTGTPISVTTGGVTGTLPAGSVVIATNVGTTNAAYCKLGASATTSDQYIAPNGGWFAFTVGAATQLTCITSTSTTTVNMVGGAGLATGTGGGGGGSGGAVTMASGAVASGAYSSGSIASGAMVDLGSQADAACGTATGTCSLIALQKYNNTATGSAIPAGTNLIGDVNLRQGGAALSITNPTFVSADPCQNAAKTTAAFSSSSGGPVSIVALSGSTKVYICAIAAITDTAIKLSFIDGTGGSCASAQHALIGSTTAANGMSLAANGGFTLGSGNGTVAVTAAASAFCFLQSGTSLVAGTVSYVQQ